MQPRALLGAATARRTCRALSTSRAASRASTSAAAPPPDSRNDSSADKGRQTSAAAFIAAQAAEEEAAAALAGKPKERIVPDPDAWTGDEPRERMLKRILEDQYKPLRIKVRTLSLDSAGLARSRSTTSPRADFPFSTTLAGLPEADSQARAASRSGVRQLTLADQCRRARRRRAASLDRWQHPPLDDRQPVGHQLQAARLLPAATRVPRVGPCPRWAEHLGQEGAPRDGAQGRRSLVAPLGAQAGAPRERLRAHARLPRRRAAEAQRRRRAGRRARRRGARARVRRGRR